MGKIQLVKEIATALVGYGYDVYISKTGEYGFYTDGLKVVSFGGSWNFSVDFSGNYKSQSCGTGWQIAKEQGVPSKADALAFICAMPPSWATNGEAVKLTTPEQYLATYGKSSGFTKFEIQEEVAA